MQIQSVANAKCKGGRDGQIQLLFATRKDTGFITSSTGTTATLTTDSSKTGGSGVCFPLFYIVLFYLLFLCLFRLFIFMLRFSRECLLDHISSQLIPLELRLPIPAVPLLSYLSQLVCILRKQYIK